MPFPFDGFIYIYIYIYKDTRFERIVVDVLTNVFSGIYVNTRKYFFNLSSS